MFDIKGPVAQELLPLLVNEITNKFNIPDDAKDVAEFIIMLIGNGRPANEIVAETKEIVNIPIDEGFIGTVFAEIGRLETIRAQNAAQSAPAAAVAPAPAPAQESMDTEEPKIPKGPARSVKFQKGSETRNKFGTISKTRTAPRGAGITKGSKDFVAKHQSGRPQAPVKGLRGKHDEKEKKLLEQIQQHMPDLLAKAQAARASQPTVELCKFGAICSKELCPFGHPTPCNKDAKVTNPRWCRFNKECNNERCNFAHSSPNYKAPPAVKQQQFNRQPTTLEQCKFNQACTNKACHRRHATSLTACQRGNDCKLPFCTFSHIINEECRHKNDCTNKVCYFKHPDGRENTFLKENTGNPSAATDERSFAVPDDQVMEQAVQ
ncbi:mRNA-binding protein nab2 [Candidozyma auris]|uniref:Nab2 type CCCH zinc finger 4 domain-containing protein n=2 Tax=Candidozyma auris TaxID=498019 RepID=A0ABF7SXT5_CANAR|nr:hypothetical protein QG37_01123 [[Candida] auris]PIS48305.1 hypothetical protein B9J08_004991 [[Candida] auris]PIS48917.1 hypothetical protein CJI97_005074 [[Candida] auris]QWW24902.1 hypothetical protein CA7LBN_003759 [[Candida] auris]